MIYLLPPRKKGGKRRGREGKMRAVRGEGEFCSKNACGGLTR